MRRLPQALLVRQWMPWGISTRWDFRWFPTWFAMLSCQHRLQPCVNKLHKISGVLVLFVTQENRVLGAVKAFLGQSWDHISCENFPQLTSLACSPKDLSKHKIASLMEFRGIFMSQYAAWQAPDPWSWWNHPGAPVLEWFPDVDGSADPENEETTRNWH